MFTFTNNVANTSYSIKPKKGNNEYVNISNDNTPKDDILLIDLKTINFENVSVELALNVLQLKHKIYYDMNQQEIIKYYNNKMKLTNNIDTILALKIILKAKLKESNSQNKINVSNYNESNNSNITLNTLNIEQKNNNMMNNNSFKIQQNNIKNVQNNYLPVNNKNISIQSIPIKNQNIINNPTTKNIQISNNQPKEFNYNNVSSAVETHNNQIVVNSNEYDINNIINSYVSKKTSCFIK